MLSALHWFFEVPSVYAANCTESQCGGSYFSMSSITCAQGCNNNGGDYHFSVQMGIDPNTGWKYTGQCDCPANDGSGCCDCQEGLC